MADIVWGVLCNSPEHTEWPSRGSINVTHMENTSCDTVENAERPMEMRSNGEIRVTQFGGGIAERIDPRPEIANAIFSDESNSFHRKYDSDEMEAAGTNRRGFLIGGLAASMTGMTTSPTVPSMLLLPLTMAMAEVSIFQSTMQEALGYW